MGSVRALADIDGHVTDTYAYTAFGELKERTGTTPNPFLFRGEQYDSDTGLYFLRARYYDPLSGRFLTFDTWPGKMLDPQTRNRYSYAFNDPVGKIDPCGRAGNTDACKLGNMMDNLIGAWYRFTVPTCEEIGIDEWLPKGLEEYGVRVAKKKGGLGCRPDLVNHCVGEVFEVKPFSARYLATASLEAWGYSMALNFTHRNERGMFFYYPGFYTFQDPPPGFLVGFDVHGPNFHFLPGAIFYSENWSQKEKEMKNYKRVLVPAAVTAAATAAVYQGASMIDVGIVLGRAVPLINSTLQTGLSVVRKMMDMMSVLAPI
jgi:RHS repeat-associated protein